MRSCLSGPLLVFQLRTWQVLEVTVTQTGGTCVSGGPGPLRTTVLGGGNPGGAGGALMAPALAEEPK